MSRPYVTPKRQKFDTWFYTRVKKVGQPIVRDIRDITDEDFESMSFNKNIAIKESLHVPGHVEVGSRGKLSFTLRHKISKRVITVQASKRQDLFKYADEYDVVKSDEDFFKDY